jgi:sulfite exporter TauE/SafE
MVGTMLPIGYGETLRGRPASSLLAYAVASVAGSAAVGIALGLVGLLFGRVIGHSSASSRAPLVAVIASLIGIAYGLADAGLIGLPRPQLRRQVPRGWSARYPPAVTGLLYGARLGVGLTTYIPSGAFYVLTVTAFLGADPVVGALVLGAFGFGRALPLFVLGPSLGGNSARLTRRLDDLGAIQEVVRLAGGVVLNAAGAFLLGVALAGAFLS